MAKTNTYFVTYKIKTDYDIEELEEVINKLFDIPKNYYPEEIPINIRKDCECFEYQKKLIIKVEES